MIWPPETRYTAANTVLLVRGLLEFAPDADLKIDRNSEHHLGLDLSQLAWPLGWFPPYLIVLFPNGSRKLYEIDEVGVSGSGELTYKAADGSSIFCWPGA